MTTNTRQYGLKISSESQSIVEDTIEVSVGESLNVFEKYDYAAARHAKYVLYEGAVLYLSCVIDATKPQNKIIDIYHEVIMKGDNAKVELLCRGAAENNKIIYRSKVKAHQGLKGLEAKQVAKLLKLNNSEVDAIPMLEIDTPNITASHSMSVSGINSEELFYLNLHGLNLLESSNTIVNGVLKV